MSDIVTNVRRRPGLAKKFHATMTGEDTNSVRAWQTDIAGQRVHVFVGVRTGKLIVMSEDLSTQVYTTTSTYLQATASQDIRGTTVGDEFFFLNVTKQPAAGAAAEVLATPDTLGFFYIRSGAFSKQYKVTITNSLGSIDLTFTTPNGLGAGDAAASTPDAIVTSLLASNVAGLASLGVSATGVGAFAGLTSSGVIHGQLSVVSPSGSTYIQPSNVSKVRIEADLPQLLPPAWDGYVMSVGEQRLLRYYRYNNARKEWLECGVWGSPNSLSNMPASLTYAGGVWAYSQTVFEGRLSGDADTNPVPVFCTSRKPSGLGAFQNRLVILAGSTVYMSGSTNPRRFFRSTVTSLLDSDTIAVGSSANSSAEYQYAVPFQKDLLLFSRKYQALIPSSGQAVTPRTATVLLTSTYSVDTTSEPVPVGRTLLFPAPRSSDFFGFMEMVSSQYTDAQYVANDATAHLPKYMGGQCRFGVASSVASMVLFAPSLDPASLVVYEYNWDGDNKVQQSWHTWRFKYPVAAAYFSNEVINVVFIQNGLLVGCTMDPRQGALTFSSTRRPYLDFNGELDVVANTCTIPSWVTTFDPTAMASLKLSVSTGALAGEEVGIASYVGNVVTTTLSFPTGKVSFGFTYRSLLSPTPPIAQDRNGVKIESAKLSVLRFGISTQNSSEYKVLITDNTSLDAEAIDQATLRYCSNELDLGQARYASVSRAVVPARTNADSTILSMYTDGTGELNFTGIDYTARFNTRIRRR